MTTQRDGDGPEQLAKAEENLETVLGTAGADTPDVEPNKSIHVALSDVMREMPAIAKTQKNQQQGFNYRGIDDICNAASPLFKKHGITLSAEVIGDVKREERQTKTGGKLFYSIFTMEYTFWARDGSSRKTQAVGEGMDSGDKSSNKAMSVAMKYAILQMLCIPTAMIDTDAGPEKHPNPPANRNAPTAEPRGQRGDVSQDQVRQIFEMWQEKHADGQDRKKFGPWVVEITDQRFASGDAKNWSLLNFTKCCDALEAL